MPLTVRGLGILACATMVVMVPAAAAAQAPKSAAAKKWSFEVYGGVTSASASTSGSSGAGFPAGTTFTTAAGRPSRVVSSWFFGDGSTLLNDVLAQFATSSGTSFSRIVPLDAALQSSGSTVKGGAVFGARLTRELSPRLSLELSVDRRVANLAFNDRVNTALAAGRDSFKSAFEGLLATTPSSNISVTSSLSTTETTASQVQAGVALGWKLVTGPKFGAYVTGGGGMAFAGGSAPEATLTGNYTFRLLSTYTIAETDKAIVKVTPAASSPLALAGGGLTWALSPQVSLKADVRASFVMAKTTTTVRGTPATATQSPTAVLPSVTTPSIQFSTQSGVTSSLSGASSDITTFRTSGFDRHVAVTFAIVRRF